MTSAPDKGSPQIPVDGEVDRLIAQFRRDLAAHALLMSGQGDDGICIDELMKRVEMELGIEPASSASRHADWLPKWVPVQPDLPQRASYALSELLQFEDARFVETSFRVLLHRMPDPAGGDFYLGNLRRGAMSRIEVLAAIRWSPEGVARGVHVDGLLLPYMLEKWQRLPVVGPIIGWARGLARLHTISRRIEELRQAHARELQALGRAQNDLVHELNARLGELRQEARKQAADQAMFANDISRRIETLLSANAQNESELGELRQSNARNESEVRELRQSSASELLALQTRLAELSAAEDERRAEAAEQRDLDPLYSRFEERFRGTQEEIRKRAEEYLPLVRQPGIGEADSPVIDVGSGRGEWLDVLRFAGMHAFGIDTNQAFVADCRARGLAVTEGDALVTLASLPDACAGAITSMHLVEHLPFATLVGLIDEAFRVLKPGGVLILETPNPENVNVGAHWFYLDPTHRNPLPPAMLSWLVQERGFSDVEVRRESEHRGFTTPDLLPADVPGAQQINQVLAGYRAAPDYAVVAWRR